MQLTDFENAAYVVFVVLLTRVILSFKLNLLIPISKVGLLDWNTFLGMDGGNGGTLYTLLKINISPRPDHYH